MCLDFKSPCISWENQRAFYGHGFNSWSLSRFPRERACSSGKSPESTCCCSVVKPVPLCRCSRFIDWPGRFIEHLGGRHMWLCFILWFLCEYHPVFQILQFFAAFPFGFPFIFLWFTGTPTGDPRWRRRVHWLGPVGDPLLVVVFGRPSTRVSSKMDGKRGKVASSMMYYHEIATSTSIFELWWYNWYNPVD